MATTGITAVVNGTGNQTDSTHTLLIPDNTLISFQLTVAGYVSGSFVWMGVDCQ
jgi:hypothetical protein